MTTVLCAISGIEYNCDHMSLYLTSRESHHPIFDVPTPKLLKLLDRWFNQELSPTENYLLYLALWKSTGLVDFRYPATQCAETASIIAQNLAPLVRMVELIDATSEARISEVLHLPTFVITPDTADLTSSPDWLEVWAGCYKDYEDSYVTATALDKLTRKESALEKYIKDRTKDISSYAKPLANWAADAGQFDIHANYIVYNEYNKHELMSSYWKRIIIACAKSESIWEIPDIDLTDLIEHCEEYIHHGSIYAHTLMALLRSGAERKKNFLDLGSMDIGANGNTFRILNANASIEDANKLALIDSAPINEPLKSQYPNTLAFLKAKMNYRMAQEYKKNQETRTEIEATNSINSSNLLDQL